MHTGLVFAQAKRTRHFSRVLGDCIESACRIIEGDLVAAIRSVVRFEHVVEAEKLRARRLLDRRRESAGLACVKSGGDASSVGVQKIRLTLDRAVGERTQLSSTSPTFSHYRNGRG